MNLFLSMIIVITLYVPCTHAEQNIINYPPYNIESTEILLKNEGEIDGDKYIITMFTDNERKIPPTIHFLKVIGNELKLIAEVEVSENTASYQFNIKNNSLYIKINTAHHGVYFSQYQFKKKNDAFYLIGVEQQSIIPTSFLLNSDNSEHSLEMWEGLSVNFLVSKAECWLETFDLEKGKKSKAWKEWSVALRKLDKGQRSTNSINRTVTFKHENLVPLNEFDSFDINYPFTCYFDHNKKFYGPSQLDPQ